MKEGMWGGENEGEERQVLDSLPHGGYNKASRQRQRTQMLERQQGWSDVRLDATRVVWKLKVDGEASEIQAFVLYPNKYGTQTRGILRLPPSEPFQA